MHSELVIEIILAAFGLITLVWLLHIGSKRYKEAERPDKFNYRWLLAEETIASGIYPPKCKVSEAAKLIDIIEVDSKSPFIYHLYNRKRNNYTKLTFIRSGHEDEFILRFYDALVKYYGGSNGRIKCITISLKRHHMQCCSYTVIDFFNEDLSRIEITVNPERITGTTLALIVAASV